MAAMGFAQLRLDVAMRILAVHWARAPTKTCTILKPKEQDCLTILQQDCLTILIGNCISPVYEQKDRSFLAWSKSWLNRSPSGWTITIHRALNRLLIQLVDVINIKVNTLRCCLVQFPLALRLLHFSSDFLYQLFRQVVSQLWYNNQGTHPEMLRNDNYPLLHLPGKELTRYCIRADIRAEASDVWLWQGMSLRIVIFPYWS